MERGQRPRREALEQREVHEVDVEVQHVELARTFALIFGITLGILAVVPGPYLVVVAASLIAGYTRGLATLLGAMGWEAGITVGLLLTLAGWIAVLATLAPLLWRETGTTWHARACFAALVLGLFGLLAWIAFVLGAAPIWAFAAMGRSFCVAIPNPAGPPYWALPRIITSSVTKRSMGLLSSNAS